MIYKNFYKLLVVAVVAMTFGFMMHSREQLQGESLGDIAPAAGKAAEPGGEFVLTSYTGKAVDSRNLRGKHLLVFFGFTHCPDICPTALLTISAALEKMGKEADGIVPIFITVDPERDTVERLKKYMEDFDKRIVALTGTADEIRDVTAAYKAYYAKAMVVDGQPEYNMNHSGFIYLMDKQGRYISHFSHDVAMEELTSKLLVAIKE